MDTVTGGYNTVETCCDGTSAENYQDAQIWGKGCGVREEFQEDTCNLIFASY